jgi:hypothetical protein
VSTTPLEQVRGRLESERGIAAGLGSEMFDPFAGLRPESCWPWPGKPNGQGYGRACHQRKVAAAHRIAWIVAKGPLKQGECVLHKCDNRKCVNPAHLFIGDRGDNARDMAAKGRQFLQQHPHRALRRHDHPLNRNPELAARGERCARAVLTEVEVLEIRARRAAGEGLKELAKEFDTSRNNVHSIARGQTWAHVGGPRTGKTPTRRLQFGRKNK